MDWLTLLLSLLFDTILWTLALLKHPTSLFLLHRIRRWPWSVFLKKTVRISRERALFYEDVDRNVSSTQRSRRGWEVGKRSQEIGPNVSSWNKSRTNRRTNELASAPLGILYSFLMTSEGRGKARQETKGGEELGGLFYVPQKPFPSRHNSRLTEWWSTSDKTYFGKLFRDFRAARFLISDSELEALLLKLLEMFRRRLWMGGKQQRGLSTRKRVAPP